MYNAFDEARVWRYSLLHHIRSAAFGTHAGRKLERIILEKRQVPDFRGSPASYLPTVEAILAALKVVQGESLKCRRVLEVGTGRHLAVPLMLRFLGLCEIVTVDLDDMLVVAQVKGMAAAIVGDPAVRSLARSFSVDVDESIALFDGVQQAPTVDAILRHVGIRFISGVDLRTIVAVSSIEAPSPDLIFSNNVLEHIGPEDLERILSSLAAVFVGKTQLHLVDLGDHFADALPGLHPLHNYRYSSRIWSILSGNRYLFTNRLTLTDYERLMINIGVNHAIRVVDSLSAAELSRLNSSIDAQFAGKSVGATRLIVQIN